ncbi:phage terminase large subunit family protein, partial [Escherichia coli]|nr:phage terminase large subunit family protein [Escherichia coli]
AKGNEGLMKSFVNNTDGKAYASGITALEVEDLIKLRRNYPEGIVPNDGLVLTAGVDVQDNRFAIVIRAWGRRDCSWLVKWTEIFGKVTLQEMSEDTNTFKGVWGELTQMLLLNPIPHASGKDMYISAISIDSADNTELVYNWVLYA